MDQDLQEYNEHEFDNLQCEIENELDEEHQDYDFYEPEDDIKITRSYKDKYEISQKELSKEQSQIYKITKEMVNNLKVDIDNIMIRNISEELAEVIKLNKESMAGLTSEELSALILAMLFIFISRSGNYPQIDKKYYSGNILDKDVFLELVHKTGIKIKRDNFTKALEVMIFQTGFVPISVKHHNKKILKSIQKQPAPKIQKIRYIQFPKKARDAYLTNPSVRIPTRSTRGVTGDELKKEIGGRKIFEEEKKKEEKRIVELNKKKHIKKILKNKIKDSDVNNKHIHEFVVDNLDNSEYQIIKNMSKLSINDKTKAEVALLAAFKKLMI